MPMPEQDRKADSLESHIIVAPFALNGVSVWRAGVWCGNRGGAAKLLERMRANPRDWRIEDVVAVCAAFGVASTAPRKGVTLQGEA
jgi:hypothetical protein